MSRPPGLPKTGGREKGTPNRRSLDLAEQLESAGLNVPSEIAKIVPQLNPSESADVLLELMVFLFPKRKAIELSGEIATPVQERELSDEERAERHKKFNAKICGMMQFDEEFAMEVIKTLLKMNQSRILPAEGLALLTSTTWLQNYAVKTSSDPAPDCNR